MFNREPITRILLGRPAALESRTARWTPGAPVRAGHWPAPVRSCS